MTPEEQTSKDNSVQSTAAKSSLGMKDLLIPVSIVIAGAFVGVGLYMSGDKSGSELAQNAPTQNQQAQEEPADTTSKVNPVEDGDWIKGDPNAPIKIVEYSDYDCPFCSRFHATMDEVVAESDGQIAWVYRHFPLEQLHPQAAAVSLAAECVGEQGGDEAFWQFSDSYFEARGAQDATPHGELIPRLVAETGVNQATFTSCFESEKYAEKIQAQTADAIETGGRGTPWSILIAPDGTTFPINGAQPKASVEQLVNFVQQEA